MRRSPISCALALPVLALLILACGGASEGHDQTTPVADTAPAGTITVTDAVASLMPGGDQAAVYLRVINNTEQDDQLLSAETRAAGSTGICDTVTEGDLVRIETRAEGFPVGAGDTLTLTSGGKHIMLWQLDPVLAQRASLALTLRFQRAEPITVDVPLRPLSSEDSGGLDHSGMNHGGMDHGTMDGSDEDEDEEVRPAANEPQGIH